MGSSFKPLKFLKPRLAETFSRFFGWLIFGLWRRATSIIWNYGGRWTRRCEWNSNLLWHVYDCLAMDHSSDLKNNTAKTFYNATQSTLLKAGSKLTNQTTGKNCFLCRPLNVSIEIQTILHPLGNKKHFGKDFVSTWGASWLKIWACVINYWEIPLK